MVASRPNRWRRLALAAALLLGVGLGWLAHRLATSTSGETGSASASGSVALVRDLPMAFLRPWETLRGDGEDAFRLDDDDPRFAVALGLDPVTLADRYRLRIVDAEGETVVESFEIERAGRLVLSLELMSAAFPPGRYQVRVQAIREGVAEARYGFEIGAPVDNDESAFQSP